jgi:hypothetical protein
MTMIRSSADDRCPINAAVKEDLVHQLGRSVVFPLLVCCSVGAASAQTAGGTSSQGGVARQPSARTAPVVGELSAMTFTNPIELGAQPVTVTLPIPTSGRNMLVASLALPAKSTLQLVVGGITFDKAPDAHFEVISTCRRATGRITRAIIMSET